MKRGVLVVAALLALAAVPLVAQEASPQPDDGLSKKDVEVLKDAVTALQQSFQPAAPASGTSASPPPQRNMAEVADKVVDLGARAIAQAAGTVQKVAPEVWRIMIRQQYAKAAGLLVVPAGLFLLSAFAWFKTGPLRVRLASPQSFAGDGDAWAIFGGYVAPIAGLLAFSIWFLNRFADSVLFLFNPEYYAFRDLLIMILNKGQGI